MIDIETDFVVVPESMNQPLARRAILPLLTKSIWPTDLPSVFWRDWILAGPDREPAVDLSSSPIEAALKFCYPTLGLGALAGLMEEFPGSETAICEVYGLRWSDRLQSIFARLRQTSGEFQTWIDEKKLSARDLAPLIATADLTDLLPLLEHLRHTSLSKSEATQALEWAVELKMLGHSTDDLLTTDGNWLAKLRRLRRPMEAAVREKAAAELKQWPWPKECDGRWANETDQRFLKIDLKAATPAELERKLEHLREISQRWRRMESN